MILPLHAGTGETHLGCWVQHWAPQCKRDTGLLEQVQPRAPEGLEHLREQEGPSALAVSSLEKKALMQQSERVTPQFYTIEYS